MKIASIYDIDLTRGRSTEECLAELPEEGSGVMVGVDSYVTIR